MKEVASMESHLLPSYHSRDPGYHHDHRLNHRPGEAWREVAVSKRGGGIGADINLLADSLTSRLRKAARQRAASSTTGTTSATTISTHGTRSAPQSGSLKKSSRSSSKRSNPGHRPSILKRGSTDTRDHSPSSMSPRGDHDLCLPNLFAKDPRRLSNHAGGGDGVGVALDGGHNHQMLDRRSPVLAFFGGGGGGGRTDGQVMWVKRAGIFQPSDKYAPGRQTLHGEDSPFSHTLPVDYETVTLGSRPDTPESGDDGGGGGGGGAGMSGMGWSSGKTTNYSRGRSGKKGLKVSWKETGGGGGGMVTKNGEASGHHEDGHHHGERLKSAGTVSGEVGGGGGGSSSNIGAFVRPKFNPGKSRVPGVGLKWKVPTPCVGKMPAPNSSCSSSSSATTGSQSSSGLSSPSSSSSPHSLPQTTPATQLLSPGSSGGSRGGGGGGGGGGGAGTHPWRALYPRDVHPVSTAMAREGTSVSKTKWQVPVPGGRAGGASRVPVLPAYASIEDLLESRQHQWDPNAVTVVFPGGRRRGGPQARNSRSRNNPTRATVDAHSLAVRLGGRNGGEEGSSQATSTITPSSANTIRSTACFSQESGELIDQGFTYRS